MGSRFSAPFQTGPEEHPVSHKMGTGSFLGVKRPGRAVDHPPPSSAGVACSRVNFTFTFTMVCVHRLIWLRRKFGVKNRERCINVRYSGTAACGTNVICCLMTVRLEVSVFSTTRSFVEDAKFFTFERHFQMDVDVDSERFRRQRRICTGQQVGYRRCKNMKDIIGLFLAKGVVSLNV